jgi:DNA gyrase subunit A
MEGTPVPSVSALSSEAEITTGIALPIQQTQDMFITFTTENGMIKKTILKEFPGPSAKTFQAVKVAPDDKLRWVRLTSGNDEILMVSRMGMAIRFSESHVRPMGLVAAGVNGMKLEGDEDRIVGMDVIKKRGDVFLITEEGIAKRTTQGQYPTQGRYGKGVLAWKSGENVRLVGAAIGKAEQRATAFLRKAAARSVRIGDAVRRNRAASGNPLFPVKENDRVLNLAPVIPLPTLKNPPAKKSRSSKKRTTSASSKKKASTTSSQSRSSKGTKAKPQPRQRTTRRKTSSSKSSSKPKQTKSRGKK